MEKRSVFVRLFALIAGCWLMAAGTALAQQSYPQLDISGFKKWEYKEAKVDPARNYFAGLTQLGGYYPTFTGGPWQERLQLRIMGQLSEDLSVTYDLEQQPETPERYDVKVKYYNNELTFGDFSASFSGNEFASASKSLNGVMLTAKDSWYDVITVPSAKLKSQTQGLTSQKGNNTKGPYNLGHGSIVEGSDRVQLNDVPLTRNVDYTIDYFEGKVTFNRILSQDDEFKYSYEYTNILDLFFPTLSKRDFFGFQSRFTIDPEEFGRPAPKPEPVIETARETFPSAGTEEAELAAEEETGRYLLRNTPVVKFTEKLTFMGTVLRKNEDYIIRYEQGQIKLLTRFLPTTEEALTVEYKFFRTETQSDAIAGIGSRGPYKLSHMHVAPESERIEVDGKLFVRDLDYQINYETAEITFGVVIGPTSQIKAVYRYNVMVLPEVPESKFPKELKIGTTYLKESAKKSAGSITSTVIEGFTGSEITSNNLHIYLKNRPVVPTDEGGSIIVKLDGVELTAEVDYAVPLTEIDPATGNVIVTPEATLAFINDRTDPTDGYGTGTIKILQPLTLTSTSQVTVTYTYYKGVVGKYSGVGDSTRGPYYLRNIRNIIPGTETVQVWEQGSSVITTYTRNSSFDADAGSTGYSINYNADTPSITFNDDLSNSKNFQIIYQYVPPQASAGGDISQAVYGFDGSFNIGEVFKIDAAYAKSEIDQVYVNVATNESRPGNGTKTFVLNSPEDINEGSEKVSVNDNLLNKDIDYYISYSKPGQINFYYITPATADAISVDYEFKRAPQPGDVLYGQETKTDTAFRLGAETRLFGDVLTIGGATKQIGFDFTPMGGTSIGLGSKYKEYNLSFNPNYHSFFTNYSYKETHSPIGTSRERYMRSYDNTVSVGVNPNDAARIDFGYRDYLTLDDLSKDPVNPVTAHSGDNLQKSYSLSVAPAELRQGPAALNLKGDIKKTHSQADFTKDSGSFSETNIDYLHGNAGLKFTDRVSMGFDIQMSEPKTTANKLPTTESESTVEALASHSRATDTSYNFSVDLTPAFLQKWTARLNFQDHLGETLVKNFVPTKEVQTTKNQTFHTDLTPISQLTASWDHNRQERSSVVVDGVNPRTERTAVSTRYTPFSWLSGGGNWTQSEAIPETGPEKKTTGKSSAYNTSWTPISWENLKLSTNYTISENSQTAPSGTFEGIRTDTNTFAQNYTLSLTPHPNVPITGGFTLENYKNKNNYPADSGRIDTETENQTITAGVTLTPLPALILNTTYNIKNTRVIRDVHVSPEARTKTIWDSKATYQLFSWGTLVYARQDENNGGEVQAGAVAALDFVKITQTLSLNVNFPIDNPVLSSFVFIASVKNVDYKNNNNPSGDDDFNANLATLEGSLNF